MSWHHGIVMPSPSVMVNKNGGKSRSSINLKKSVEVCCSPVVVSLSNHERNQLVQRFLNYNALHNINLAFPLTF